MGGASFFAGTIVGAAVGGLGAVWNAQGLAKVRVLGSPLGGRKLLVEAPTGPQFPFVLLDRALLHSRMVAGRAHARRDALDTRPAEEASGVVADLPQSARKSLTQKLAHVRKREGDIIDVDRRELIRERSAPSPPIDGELHLQPRPAKPHTHTASRLGAQLSMAFDLGRTGPGGWWILDEPEVHLDGQVLVPDLAGCRKAETPNFDRALAYYAERPCWVGEILYPSTESLDRLKKLRAYHRGGGAWVWLVHPERRSVEVYTHREEGYLLLETYEGEETARPFDAIAIELGTLWM